MLRKTLNLLLPLLIIGCFTVGLQIAAAQESQMMSVTPPLFQLAVEPGNIWQSSVKVVNGNNYPLTVYAEVVDFSATGETGQGNFTPILEKDPDGPTLAHWIDIIDGPHVIQPEQTKDIPFFVDVPEDASPGGHYAAILISTEPHTSDQNQALAVQTSQAVTSLFFIRIEGEINETGFIREFSPIDKFVETPDVEFSLRFENKGNVHLQPRGDIVITNMWGAERGTIPVNYQTHYGNVLPRTVRNFRFSWESEFKIADIGRYTAEAVLTYGDKGVKSEMAKTYFWVVPIKGTIISISAVLIFVSIIVMIVRAYIRRMLTLAGVDPASRTNKSHERESENDPVLSANISAPIKSGVLDLRTKLNQVEETMDVFKTVVKFIFDYKKFFVSILMLIIIFIISVQYIGNATETDRDYTVEVKNTSTVIPTTESE